MPQAISSADDKVYDYEVSNASEKNFDLGSHTLSATLIKNYREVEVVDADAFTVTPLENRVKHVFTNSDPTVTLADDLPEGANATVVFTGGGSLTVTLEDTSTTTLNGGTSDVTVSSGSFELGVGEDGAYYLA